MREKIRNFNAAAALRFELERTAHQIWVATNEGELLAFGEQIVGARLAVIFVEGGFVFKQVEVRWSADHVEINDALGSRGKVRHRGAGQGMAGGRRSGALIE